MRQRYFTKKIIPEKWQSKVKKCMAKLTSQERIFWRAAFLERLFFQKTLLSLAATFSQ